MLEIIFQAPKSQIFKSMLVKWNMRAPDESTRTSRDFPSVYFDRATPRRQSTALLINNDVIITAPNSSSYINLITNLSKQRRRRLTQRSHSAPSVFTNTREPLGDSLDPRPPKSTPIIVRQAFIGVILYICDRQEAILLSAVDENRFQTMFQTYMIDKDKGRMRIRTKVSLALGVVFICLAIGTITAHFLEELKWVDSFYLAVTSVTTVGYGDYAFTTAKGRCFAVIWLLVSTLAVARAFLYLAEFRIDKRNRRIAKWVLHKKMTLADLIAADLDNDGSISKSEFVIYKLKEMGKVDENDLLQISRQFDEMDDTHCGKITLADLMESN